MQVDAQGLSLTGPRAAVAAYDRAISHLVRFQPEVVDAAGESAAGGCVMGRLLGAYLGLMSTEEGAVSVAREALGPYAAPDADESALQPRERAHLAAARRWIGGDMAGAGALLGAISIEYPTDLLALSAGHQIDFFRGDAINLRDRIGRALGAWRGEDPRTGFLYGMYAFGLEECNQYGQAADAGSKAVDANPDDVWGIHAVVHTYEMRGDIPHGVPLHAGPPRGLGGRQLPQRPQRVALRALPAPGRRHRGALGVYDTFLHHGQLRRRRARASRRHRAAVAAAPGRDASGRPLAAARRGVDAHPRARVLSVQRHARDHGVRRHRRARPRPRGRPGPRARGCRGRPEDHRLGDDVGRGPAGLPQPAALRRRAVRPRAHRADADPHPGARVRRESRAARRRRTDAARGGHQGRADRPGERAGQRAAGQPGVQHLCLVQARPAARPRRRHGGCRGGDRAGARARRRHPRWRQPAEPGREARRRSWSAGSQPRRR